jgi:hypothetical protein
MGVGRKRAAPIALPFLQDICRKHRIARPRGKPFSFVGEKGARFFLAKHE